MRSFVDQYKLTHHNDNSELVIFDSSSGLEVVWYKEKNDPPLKLFIDIDHFVGQLKTFPAAKQGAFNQALGKKSKRVIDATGGWGGDTLLMCSQGYQVTIIERHPIMALLLKDAMNRLAVTDWAHVHNIKIPQVLEGNAVDLLPENELSSDCIYLDPMFPLKRKKSAAVNKKIQFLQWLVGADHDADHLLKSALESSCSRVAVKRPDYAQSILAECQKPSAQFSSKLVHYDVYLKTNC